jgi:NAD(P)-dependent dehydrogenase (short-subunit alcohol dehydrogenase family)
MTSPKVSKRVIVNVTRYGVHAKYVKADLSKVTEIEALWTEVMHLYPAGIDILINNAGRQGHHSCITPFPPR